MTSIAAEAERTPHRERSEASFAPAPEKPNSAKRAQGLLASYADVAKQRLEDEAFERAMVAKHTNM